jgi:hypothetical protein
LSRSNQRHAGDLAHTVLRLRFRRALSLRQVERLLLTGNDALGLPGLRRARLENFLILIGHFNAARIGWPFLHGAGLRRNNRRIPVRSGLRAGAEGQQARHTDHGHANDAGCQHQAPTRSCRPIHRSTCCDCCCGRRSRCSGKVIVGAVFTRLGRWRRHGHWSERRWGLGSPLGTGIPHGSLEFGQHVVKAPGSLSIASRR